MYLDTSSSAHCFILHVWPWIGNHLILYSGSLQSIIMNTFGFRTLNYHIRRILTKSVNQFQHQGLLFFKWDQRPPLSEDPNCYCPSLLSYCVNKCNHPSHQKLMSVFVILLHYIDYIICFRFLMIECQWKSVCFTFWKTFLALLNLWTISKDTTPSSLWWKDLNHVKIFLISSLKRVSWRNNLPETFLDRYYI